MVIDPYAALCQWEVERATLNSTAALLGWDERTGLPPKGQAFRGEQLALLARLSHERLTDPSLAEWLERAEAQEYPEDSVEAANIRGIRRLQRRAVKIPAKLVEALARAASAGQNAWELARKDNDFPAFLPHLETMFRLKREEAQAVGYQAHPYDALLDEFEPGATTAELLGVFSSLRQALVPLIAEIRQVGRQARAEILQRRFPIEQQRQFCEFIIRQVGFDLEAGRLDVTVHPFCSGIAPGDVRITTRYNETAFPEAFFGTLHEVGHGLYEQNLPAEAFGLPAGTACSLGIHESQSRLWENFIGRSRPFWEFAWQPARQYFPEALGDVTLEQFHDAVNTVRASFIRIEADEATYNLHILLRFELELGLLSGDLPPAELPAAWNERFKDLFGLTVPDDRHGCLQDVHWSAGLVGYFPTYTLGNLYAAQFMTKIRRDLLDLDEDLKRGEFQRLRCWLKENIHARGQQYSAAQLCRQVTGAPLTSDPLLEHLRRKFLP